MLTEEVRLVTCLDMYDACVANHLFPSYTGRGRTRCGRAWKGVEGRGRAWKDVEGRGRTGRGRSKPPFIRVWDLFVRLETLSRSL